MTKPTARKKAQHAKNKKKSQYKDKKPKQQAWLTPVQQIIEYIAQPTLQNIKRAHVMLFSQEDFILTDKDATEIASCLDDAIEKKQRLEEGISRLLFEMLHYLYDNFEVELDKIDQFESVKVVRAYLSLERILDKVENQQYIDPQAEIKDVALFYSILFNKIENLKLLTATSSLEIDYLNFYKQDKITYLYFAVKCANKAAVELLCQRGADLACVCTIDGKQQTALQCAIDQSNIDILKILLQHGADLNALLANGMTPLCYAIKHGCDAKTIEALISCGANVNKPCRVSEKILSSPLLMAIDSGNLANIKLLCPAGVSLSACSFVENEEEVDVKNINDHIFENKQHREQIINFLFNEIFWHNSQQNLDVTSILDSAIYFDMTEICCGAKSDLELTKLVLDNISRHQLKDKVDHEKVDEAIKLAVMGHFSYSGMVELQNSVKQLISKYLAPAEDLLPAQDALVLADSIPCNSVYDLSMSSHAISFPEPRAALGDNNEFLPDPTSFIKVIESAQENTSLGDAVHALEKAENAVIAELNEIIAEIKIDDQTPSFLLAENIYRVEDQKNMQMYVCLSNDFFEHIKKMPDNLIDKFRKMPKTSARGGNIKPLVISDMNLNIQIKDPAGKADLKINGEVKYEMRDGASKQRLLLALTQIRHENEIYHILLPYQYLPKGVHKKSDVRNLSAKIKSNKTPLTIKWPVALSAPVAKQDKKQTLRKPCTDKAKRSSIYLTQQLFFNQNQLNNEAMADHSVCTRQSNIGDMAYNK